MTSVVELKQKAKAWALRQDKNVELAECLQKIYKIDRAEFGTLLGKPRLGSRKAYYLRKIGEQVERGKFSKARLRKIGWTKLQVIGHNLTERMLKLAEKNTTQKLKLLVRGEIVPRDVHCVLMYFTPHQYRVFEEAVLLHGAAPTRSGRGLVNKEQALVALIKASRQRMLAITRPGSGTFKRMAPHR